MKKGRDHLIVLASGAMEFTWMYSWATIIYNSAVGKHFPLIEGVYIFGLSVFITYFSKNWRMTIFIALQIICSIAIALRTLYIFFNAASPFFSQAWVIELFSKTNSPVEYFILAFTILCVFVFWAGGVALARRSTSYNAISSRFEMGIAALFLLLFINSAAGLHDPMAELLLFPFFIFGLMAMGLALNRSSAHRNFKSGYRGIGALISFSVVILLFGAGFGALFLPYLLLAAELLKSAAKPLLAFLVSSIPVLFRFSKPPPLVVGVGSRKQMDLGTSIYTEPQLLDTIFIWILNSLTIIGISGLIIIGVIYLYKWLSKRPSRSKRPRKGWNIWNLILTGFGIIVEFISSLLEKISWKIPVRGGVRNMLRFYASLLNWGKRSGVSCYISETPSEYGERLTKLFPALESEIDTIVEYYNMKVYGEIEIEDSQLITARQARRRLYSPAYWPSRLKSRMFFDNDIRVSD